MKLVIAKVTEVYFDGEAASVTLPGAEGEMTVLPEHEPLITTLKKGTVTVRQKSEASPLTEKTQTFEIEGGILEINREGATVVL
jgi:F-type H+-transporting ATPase subunit epsilon